MICIRRENNWKSDINQPCKPNKGKFVKLLDTGNLRLMTQRGVFYKKQKTEI